MPSPFNRLSKVSKLFFLGIILGIGLISMFLFSTEISRAEFCINKYADQSGKCYPNLDFKSGNPVGASFIKNTPPPQRYWVQNNQGRPLYCVTKNGDKKCVESINAPKVELIGRDDVSEGQSNRLFRFRIKGATPKYWRIAEEAESTGTMGLASCGCDTSDESFDSDCDERSFGQGHTPDEIGGLGDCYDQEIRNGVVYHNNSYYEVGGRNYSHARKTYKYDNRTLKMCLKVACVDHHDEDSPRSGFGRCGCDKSDDDDDCTGVNGNFDCYDKWHFDWEYYDDTHDVTYYRRVKKVPAFTFQKLSYNNYYSVANPAAKNIPRTKESYVFYYSTGTSISESSPVQPEAAVDVPSQGTYYSEASSNLTGCAYNGKIKKVEKRSDTEADYWIVGTGQATNRLETQIDQSERLKAGRSLQYNVGSSGNSQEVGFGEACRIQVASPVGAEAEYVYYTGYVEIPVPIIDSFQATSRGYNPVPGLKVSNRYGNASTLDILTSEKSVPVTVSWSSSYGPWTKLAVDNNVSHDIQLDKQSGTMDFNLTPGDYSYTFFAWNERKDANEEGESSWATRSKVNVKVQKEPFSVDIIEFETPSEGHAKVYYKITGAKKAWINWQMNLIKCGTSDPCRTLPIAPSVFNDSKNKPNGEVLEFNDIDPSDTVFTLFAQDSEGNVISDSIKLDRKVGFFTFLVQGIELGQKYYNMSIIDMFKQGTCAGQDSDVVKTLCNVLSIKNIVGGLVDWVLPSILTAVLPGIGTLGAKAIGMAVKFFMPFLAGFAGMIFKWVDYTFLHPTNIVLVDGKSDLTTLSNMLKGGLSGLVGGLLPGIFDGLLGLGDLPGMKCIRGKIGETATGIMTSLFTSLGNDILKPIGKIFEGAKDIPVIGGLLSNVSNAVTSLGNEFGKAVTPEDTVGGGNPGYATGLGLGGAAGGALGNIIGSAIGDACGELCKKPKEVLGLASTFVGELIPLPEDKGNLEVSVNVDNYTGIPTGIRVDEPKKSCGEKQKLSTAQGTWIRNAGGCSNTRCGMGTRIVTYTCSDPGLGCPGGTKAAEIEDCKGPLGDCAGDKIVGGAGNKIVGDLVVGGGHAPISRVQWGQNMYQTAYAVITGTQILAKDVEGMVTDGHARAIADYVINDNVDTTEMTYNQAKTIECINNGGGTVSCKAKFK